MKRLEKTIDLMVKPIPPYNFEKTVYNPSHFPTEMEEYRAGKFWKTRRFEGEVIGIKLEKKGSTEEPKVRIRVYFSSDLGQNKLLEELNYQYGFKEDLSSFYQKFRDDKFLGPVLRRMLGARSRSDPLYDLTMISIVLQNTAVRRSVEMMKSLLENYGEKVKFDDKELYGIWEPEKLAGAKEEDLRDLKLGYRAKYLKKISERFAEGKVDERRLREIDKEEAKGELTKLYGIGPASADILLFESLRHYNARDYIPPWEQKIFSRIFYDKEKVPKEKIKEELKERYGRWKALAFWYIHTDLFWRHKESL